jgi:hypothetical protein
MGLFDFLKKKNPSEESNLKADVTAEKPVAATAPPADGKSINDLYAQKPSERPQVNQSLTDPIAEKETFDFIFKYSEYVVRYLNMMFQGNNSPIAAYEKNNGELIGYLFVAEDMSYNLTVEQVIEKMETEFESRMAQGVILSWSIFYHSEFNNDGNHKVAGEYSKTRAITIKYRVQNELTGYVGLPYTLTGDEVKFKGFSGFSREQNNQIMSVTTEATKDYFQEKIEIKPEIYENEAGLKIKKVNNGTLGNMWGGIIGYRKLSSSATILIEYTAYLFVSGAKRSIGEIVIYELNYGDVIFRGVQTLAESRKSVIPVVAATNYIDVVNKQINVWENANNLEAVINGGARDTFAVTYFATDYAENKAIYHSSKKMNIAFSGILFVLDTGAEDELANGTPLAEGFAAYMPHNTLGEFGVYDFMGILEDYRENKVLDDDISYGYILTVRLINNEDIEDFFTIPMFVNKENMRINELKKGMKISGGFQLLGEIRGG